MRINEMTKWENVLETGSVGVEALKNFAEGNLNCEQIQVVFRNRYPEASATVRNLIRTKGTQEARKLARTALKRRGLLK